MKLKGANAVRLWWILNRNDEFPDCVTCSEFEYIIIEKKSDEVMDIYCKFFDNKKGKNCG